MKKALVIAVCLMFIATAAMAMAGKTAPAGNSNIGHLYLYEKDPATWEIVDDGAWGKMKYNLAGPEFSFVFNGHGLEPGVDYTLIYYPDVEIGNPYPREGVICLGSGVANNGGNVNIAASVDTGDLPSATDANDGAKIWLVLSADVDCDAGQMGPAWNPTDYLFEYNLITFDDTDVP